MSLCSLPEPAAIDGLQCEGLLDINRRLAHAVCCNLLELEVGPVLKVTRVAMALLCPPAPHTTHTTNAPNERLGCWVQRRSEPCASLGGSHARVRGVGLDEQIRVGPTLDDLAVGHHNDVVGILDGPQLVRYHDASAVGLRVAHQPCAAVASLDPRASG